MVLTRIASVAYFFALSASLVIAVEPATNENPVPVIANADGNAAARVETDAAVVGAGPFADGHVIRAVGSGTLAARLLQKTSFSAPQGQIKFEIQILSVDAETRDKIYAELGDEKVHTEISKVSQPGDESATVSADDSALSSHHQVTTSSIVSTAVLDHDQVERIYALAKESGTSKVIARPSIIASDGQVAGMQQQVQRPFLSDFEEVEQDGQVAVQSGIQVLSEGTDLTVMADFEGDGLNVHAKIEHSRVSDVQQYNVYGIGAVQKVIQVPSHEVRAASARAMLLPKQTLLLDPYFQTKERSEAIIGTPILTKLPYMQKTFSKSEPVEVTMNTIVLLKAKKL